MARDQARDWMWSEALQMLAQAERLHRQVFRPVPSAHGVSWEPPVDVIEPERARQPEYGKCDEAQAHP